MYKLGIIFSVFLMLVCLGSVQAQQPSRNPNVFQIIASECLHQPSIRTQTGFRVQGLVGIVTALHGVVDCAVINADSPDMEPFKNLYKDQVDIDHDVVLLFPTKAGDPERLKNMQGLLDNKDPVTPDEIYVVGHPYGMQEQSTSRIMRIRDEVTKILGGFPDIAKLLEQRNSPRLDLPVLDIEGTLVPGHSGAPIFNHNDQVIGVGNGGLHDGTTEFVWAIPWRDIVWTKVDNNEQIKTKLESLNVQDPTTIFEFPQRFSSTLPEQWVLLEITLGDPGETIQQAVLQGDECLKTDTYVCTYELATEDIWPLSSAVKIKSAGKIIATGRIGDEWLTPEGSTIGRYKVSYCEAFLCLKAVEQSLHEVKLINQNGDPVSGAKITIIWLKIGDIEIKSKEERTGNRGTFLISEVPENAIHVKITVNQDPCYEWNDNLPVAELWKPLTIPIKPVCIPTPVSTLTPTLVATSTLSPTFTAIPTPIPSIQSIIGQRFDAVIKIDNQPSYSVSRTSSITLETKTSEPVRIEFILQDADSNILPSGQALYTWSFYPPDLANAQRVGNRNDVLIYTAPADRRGQLIMVTIQAPGLYRVIPIQVTID